MNKTTDAQYEAQQFTINKISEISGHEVKEIKYALIEVGAACLVAAKQGKPLDPRQLIEQSTTLNRFAGILSEAWEAGLIPNDRTAEERRDDARDKNEDRAAMEAEQREGTHGPLNDGDHTNP